MPQCWAHPAPCGAWVACQGLGTLQRTHGAWDSLAMTHASAPL